MGVTEMTVRNMQIFVELCKQGSVTKAAKVLHMSQPAVTRVIRDMETHYGLCLFERMHRGITITESGKALYAYALHITDTFDQMEMTLRDWDRIGVLRVGTSITVGNHILPGLVKRFQSERPDLQVRAFIHSSARIREALLDNRLDLAIIEGEADSEELVAEPFAADKLIPVVTPGHPLAGKNNVPLERMAEENMLLREQGSAGRSLIDGAFAVQGITLQPMWESVSTQALVNAVCDGIGISILPELLVKNDLSAGRVATCTLQGTPLTRNFNLLWHRKKHITQMMTRMMELCREICMQV
jgi:DNA-binding transcriptional LysR family regulator